MASRMVGLELIFFVIDLAELLQREVCPVSVQPERREAQGQVQVRGRPRVRAASAAAHVQQPPGIERSFKRLKKSGRQFWNSKMAGCKADV